MEGVVCDVTVLKRKKKGSRKRKKEKHDSEELEKEKEKALEQKPINIIVPRKKVRPIVDAL